MPCLSMQLKSMVLVDNGFALSLSRGSAYYTGITHYVHRQGLCTYGEADVRHGAICHG